MSFTLPPTKSAGDVWRSADWNQLLAAVGSLIGSDITSYAKTVDMDIDGGDLSSDVNMYATMVDEINGYVLSIDQNNYLLNVTKIDGSSTSDVFTDTGVPQAAFYSAFHSNFVKYALYIANDGVSVKIIKNGAVLQTIDVTGLVATPVGYNQIDISGSGKYIAIVTQNASNTKRRHILVYTGS
jgi:hypothetical protein